jgi:hypothetical protein
MRTILFFSTFILLFITACSDKKTPNPPDVRDAELAYFTERYDLHYDGEYPKRLEVRFEAIDDCDDSGSCVAGYCLTDYDAGGQYREVAFDIAIWGELSDVRKEALVFHEYGHCVQDRGHTDELSFMLPSLQTSDFYLEFREELYVELFGKGPIDDDGMDLLTVPPNEKVHRLHSDF